MTNAAQQYIDLFRDNRTLVDEGCPPELNAPREAAAARLAAAGVGKAKDFTTTDPEEMLAPDYALNLRRCEVPFRREGLFSCAVPNLSTELHYLINEQYAAAPSGAAGRDGATGKPRLQAGVFAGSLRDFAAQYPAVAAQYYNRLASEATEATAPGEAALNTMFAADGFVLYLPDEIVLDKPVQVISLLRPIGDFMACQRLLVIVGVRARATLLFCDHSGTSEARMLALQVAEIYIGEDADVDFYGLEENGSNVGRLSQIVVYQCERSRSSIGLFSLMAGRTRCRCHVVLDGEGAQTQLFGMVIADADQQVDYLTLIDHRCAGCTSDELFKYVLDEAARGGFVGRIVVRKGAVRTAARQTVRGLCQTDQARMMARPELEIYADDVQCSHGATVGQLDAAALFYMRTRGIPEAEARMLLMFAFMGDVIERVRLEPLRDRLRQLVEKRFRGELSRCDSCKIKR